jgi:hypothetical protein
MGASAHPQLRLPGVAGMAHGAVLRPNSGTQGRRVPHRPATSARPLAAARQRSRSAVPVQGSHHTCGEGPCHDVPLGAGESHAAP